MAALIVFHIPMTEPLYCSAVNHRSLDPQRCRARWAIGGLNNGKAVRRSSEDYRRSAPLVRGFSSCGLPGPDGFPCSAVRFTAGAPRNLQQPQLRQQQIILDHDATLGQLKKLPAGRSELAPAPAGPSLSSPPPAAQPGEFGFFIFLKKQGAQRS